MGHLWEAVRQESRGCCGGNVRGRARADDDPRAGEFETVLVCAVDKAQARVVFNCCKALFALPPLRPLVAGQTTDAIPATTRGAQTATCWLDETSAAVDRQDRPGDEAIAHQEDDTRGDLFRSADPPDR